jgi:hypothetical protein
MNVDDCVWIRLTYIHKIVGEETVKLFDISKDMKNCRSLLINGLRRCVQLTIEQVFYSIYRDMYVLLV